MKYEFIIIYSICNEKFNLLNNSSCIGIEVIFNKKLNIEEKRILILNKIINYHNNSKKHLELIGVIIENEIRIVSITKI